MLKTAEAGRRQTATVEQVRLRLAIAVEQIQDGVAITDPAGRVAYANPSFATARGRDADHLVGQMLADVLGQAKGEKDNPRGLRLALDLGRTWERHLSWLMPDGRTREIEVKLSPVRESTGRLVNFIVLSRDVTQEVQFQERLRQWQKMEALGTMAGGIAHDFNNMLLPILINAELALSDEDPDGPKARRLQQIVEAAKRGRDMVKQIITFAQEREMERGPVEVYPVVRDALKLLRATLPKNIAIIEHIETREATVLGDPTQVTQLLVNLATNAAHAMRARGGKLVVELAEVRTDGAADGEPGGPGPGRYVRLTVRDTGEGIAPQILDRIFDPFFTTKKKGEGAGMGLAVVHGIVKGHEGSVTVESEVGKGSTFRVYLPAVPPAKPAAAVVAEHPPRGAESILFIDDEEIQVRAMQKLLEHLGYRVLALTDARAALEAFRAAPGSFDLVITDMSMPAMSGSDVARQALRIKPAVPIILCTGYSESIDESRALAQGVRAFMMKPYSVRDIAKTIRSVLETR